jgi:hypothetical protein
LTACVPKVSFCCKIIRIYFICRHISL